MLVLDRTRDETLIKQFDSMYAFDSFKPDLTTTNYLSPARYPSMSMLVMRSLYYAEIFLKAVHNNDTPFEEF